MYDKATIEAAARVCDEIESREIQTLDRQYRAALSYGRMVARYLASQIRALANAHDAATDDDADDAAMLNNAGALE